MKGTLDGDYARQREERLALKYRLRRRADEAIRAIEAFRPRPERILDLGTAEGRMLWRLQARYPSSHCVGLEYSADLLALGARLFHDLCFLRADAQRMPYFKTAAFDVIVAAAIIEHLPDPAEMLKESARVLKPGGILILTTPHPFWEKLAGRLGMIEGDHQSVMSLRVLREEGRGAGFDVLEAKGFMISPVGFPGERIIEAILRRVGLDRQLANQLLVLGKPRGAGS